MKRYCKILDLIPDEKLIAEYKAYHQNVWQEIKDSILNFGIVNMEIYCNHNRLVMIMETADDFDATAKAAADANNPKVQEWEALMWKYQQKIPWANQNEKWLDADLIFKLCKD